MTNKKDACSNCCHNLAVGRKGEEVKKSACERELQDKCFLLWQVAMVEIVLGF